MAKLLLLPTQHNTLTTTQEINQKLKTMTHTVKGHDGHVPLFPEATSMFAFCCRGTSTYAVKCRYMYDKSRQLVTLQNSRNQPVHQCLPRGEEWVRTSTGNETLICTAVYCDCDNSPDMITSHRAGKCATVTVQPLMLLCVTHT